MFRFRAVWVRLLVVAAVALWLTGEPVAAAGDRATFLFFWAVDCPHCADAEPFVRKLESEHPRLEFERWEVKLDAKGRRRFAQEVKRLKIRDPAVPTFVCGDRYLVGFTKGASEPHVRQLARGCKT